MSFPNVSIGNPDTERFWTREHWKARGDGVIVPYNKPFLAAHSMSQSNQVSSKSTKARLS